MAQPTPAPIDSSQLVSLALRVMEANSFPFLATIDGDQPRLRPVSPVRTEGFKVYVANLRRYHKTREIEANPKVEVCYLDSEHNQVRISGVARVVTDRALLEAIWNETPLLRQFLGRPDHPELVIYCIEPKRVRYMQEWALEYFEVPFQTATLL